MLKAGNLILRNHIFLLEIKYFCKLKELPWAELSPNYVSLFVGCFDKHIRAEALIFGLNLITSHPKFTPTRSETWIFCVSPRAGWAGMGLRGLRFGFFGELSPPGALRGTRDTVWSGCCYHQLEFCTAHIPDLQSPCPFCSGNIFCWNPLFFSKGRNSSGRNSF